MPKELSEESGNASGREPRTPLGALESLRRETLDRDHASRRELELAALEISGEVGYRKLTVQRILDRSTVSRARFYKGFADKGDCYARAYSVAIERLERDVLAASATTTNWLSGFRQGLEEMARFLGSQPLLAKGLLAEVHVAGGAAMVKRKEVLERLSLAIDIARRESDSRHRPPPVSASFILNAIEAALVRTLVNGQPEEFAASIPDLVYIAVSIYFGEAAAREAIGGIS